MMRWLKNLFKKKKPPRYQDNGYLVEDYRGMVITQEEHRRLWGFPGYPTGHYTNCDCTHCTTATHHYRINTGYSMVRGDYTPTRENVYDYLNTLNSGNFGYNSEGIIREVDFSPKKDIKSHKLVNPKPNPVTRITIREEIINIFGQPE
jgi:hypothetical protein